MNVEKPGLSLQKGKGSGSMRSMTNDRVNKEGIWCFGIIMFDDPPSSTPAP